MELIIIFSIIFLFLIIAILKMYNKLIKLRNKVNQSESGIDVYLNPNLDPRGDGYNIIQSKLAIGAGKLLGMGLLKGNQTQLG